MNKETRTAWLEGFAAGETQKYGCPYRPSTVEAKAWEAGWDQGDLKRNGKPFRDRPLASDVDELPSTNS
jgi:hypothetical protein